MFSQIRPVVAEPQVSGSPTRPSTPAGRFSRDKRGNVAIIDPGPDDERHIEALLGAVLLVDEKPEAARSRKKRSTPSVVSGADVHSTTVAPAARSASADSRIARRIAGDGTQSLTWGSSAIRSRDTSTAAGSAKGTGELSAPGCAMT